MNYRGVEIIASDYLVKDGIPYTQIRTWRERLFSRPWKSFKKTKEVTPKVPDENMYYSELMRRVVAHPSIVEKIKEAVDAEETRHMRYKLATVFPNRVLTKDDFGI